MLVLTRRPAPAARRSDESLVVLLLPAGEEVKLYVIPASSGRDVRVGVEAPRSVQVERGEVYRETRQADPHRIDQDRDWEEWAKNQKGGPTP